MDPLGSLISQRRDVYFKFNESTTTNFSSSLAFTNTSDVNNETVTQKEPTLFELAAQQKANTLPPPVNSSRRNSSRRVTPPAEPQTQVQSLLTLQPSQQFEYTTYNPALETAYSPVNKSTLARTQPYNGPDIVSVFPRFTPVEVLDKLNARHSSAAVIRVQE
jgi:hypothetical protein